MKPDRLYHFTCEHGHHRISRSALIIPQITHPLLRMKASWFTTQAHPDREATGLGQHYTACDRMAHRYVISDLSGCRPWLTSAERMTGLRQVPGTVTDLESYGDPQHWWIATCPVPAEWDQSWQPVPAP